MTHSGPPAAQQRISSALTLAVYADWLCTPDSVPSHAVAQLLTLTRHLATGGVDEDRLAGELATTVWEQPEGQARSGTQQILAAVATGAAWWEAAPAYRNGAGGWGSDAAVRAGAAGLLPGSGVGAVAQIGRRSAAVTHTHPDARDAAAVHAAAVSLAAADGDFEILDTDKLLAVLTEQSRGATMRAQLALVRQLGRDRATPEDTAKVLGSGRSACGAAGAALAAYLICPREPLADIALAHQMGPEWHAAAIMTATIGGAHNPRARPPVTWSLPPALKPQVVAVASRLAAAPPAVSRHYHRVSGFPAPARFSSTAGPVVTQLS